MKLENFVFLQLESCNLVNIFRRKLRASYEREKKSSLDLTDQNFAFWEKFLIKFR